MKTRYFKFKDKVKYHSVIAGQQDRQANKTGRTTRQAGQQDRQANKTGKPTRQVGQQGREAGLNNVPILTAHVFCGSY
jgi:hypothetical protein